MKQGSIFIIFTLYVLTGYAQNQDIKFGVSASTQVFQSTRFMDSIYKPQNSDFTYKEDQKGTGIINRAHIFNGYSIGGVIRYTFRKSTLSLEPQYFMQRSIFVFQKESYSERVIGMKAFRLPIFYSFKLFKKKNSMFLSIGTVLTVANHYDFQHPGNEFLYANGPIYNGGVDYGDGHFNSVLYTDEAYWQNYFGIGKNIGDFKLTLRFMTRSIKSSEKIAAEIAQLELNISYHIIGISDLKKKRKIYHE